MNFFKSLRGGFGCLLGISLCVFWESLAWAADATTQLRQFGRMDAISANFTQIQTLTDGRTEKSEGTMILRKPGKFRWEYLKPYKQLMVSDGVRVWFYDADLNQVIIRNLSKAIGDKPALLLSDPNQAEKYFNIRNIPSTEEKLAWLEATPKQKDASFTKIQIGFAGNTPKLFILDDVFGNQTRLRLTDINLNGTTSNAQFTFSPPKDADVMTD